MILEAVFFNLYSIRNFQKEPVFEIPAYDRLGGTHACARSTFRTFSVQQVHDLDSTLSNYSYQRINYTNVLQLYLYHL